MKNEKSVKPPVVVRIDNLGATFITSNNTIKSYAKHCPIMYKIVNEYVEEGMVKIVFIKSVENDSNIPMKYLHAELHYNHKKRSIVENT